MKKTLILLLFPVILHSQTRFYLTQLTPAITTASVNAAWNVTTGYQIFFLNTYRDRSSGVTYTTGVSGTASPKQMLDLQFVSAPLIAQTINGTLTGQVRLSRTSGTVTVTGIIYLRKISSSGTITDIGSTNSASLSAGTITNKSFSLSLSSVSISAGDRIIIELGGNYTSGSSTTIAINAALTTVNSSDLPVDNTSTSTFNPWFEFSQTLKFQTQANTF